MTTANQQAGDMSKAETGSPGAAAQSVRSHGYLTRTASSLVGGAVLVIGLLYLMLEFNHTDQIVDSLFVSMLVGATLILLIGLRSVLNFLATRGETFYAFVLAATDPKEAYRRHAHLFATVTNTTRMTLSGVVYGLLIGFAPFVLNAWPQDAALRLGLAVFLFGVNFTTGVAFYALLSFFAFSTQMGAQARVDLWQASNPSTDFLTGATRRISVLASGYVAICLSSVLFSVLPPQGAVIAYSVFAAFMLVLSILVPALPLARKIHDAKFAALRELDEKVQAAFFEVLSKDPEQFDQRLSRLHALLALRERVERLQSWPFKVRSVTSAASVLFFSSLPVILQLLLERLGE